MKSIQLLASLAIALFIFSNSTIAQICEPGEALGVHATGKVSMMHGPNGRLWTPENPMVLMDSSISMNPINIFKNSGFWLSGLDPGSNRKGAISGVEGQEVWYPGHLDGYGLPSAEWCNDYDKVWTVTKDDLDRFRADFWDNEIIDEEHPAIFAWPGFGNPNSEALNGFELAPFRGLPGFWDFGTDSQLDDTYNPELGDFPLEPQISNDNYPCPSTLQYWVMNENTVARDFFDPIRMSVAVTAFSYDHLFPNASMVFYKFELVNHAVEEIQDFNFGIWMDPDLGCPEDDYMGYDKERNCVYVHNADSQDGDENGECWSGEDGISGKLPQIAIKSYRGFLNSNFQEERISSFVPFQNDAPSTSPYALPTTEDEYANVLEGKWQNGMNITEGGLGVNQDSAITTFAFSDSPDDSLGWSMCSQNFPLGDKSFVFSNNVDVLQPGTRKEMFIGVYITYGDDNVDCPSMDEMIAQMDTVYNFSCPSNPYIIPPVLPDTVILNTLQIFPNPSSGELTINSAPYQEIAQVFIYDGSGRLMKSFQGEDQIIDNRTVNFSGNGFHIVKVILDTGIVITEKILFH